MLTLISNPRSYGEFAVSSSAFLYLQTPLDTLNNKYSQLLDDYLSNPGQIGTLAKQITRLAQQALLHFHEGNYSETDKHLKEMFLTIITLAETPLKLIALFYATTALLVPITCLTPVSFAVDLFSGVLEVRQAFKEGYPKDRIDEILQKKWLASAVQHASFFTMNYLSFRTCFLRRRWTVDFIPVRYLVLQIILLAFTKYVLKNQEWASKQAASFKSSLLQIFTYRYPIEITQQFLASWVELYPIFSGNSNFAGWEEFEKENREALKVRNDGSEIDKFLQKYKNKVSPPELLGLSSTHTQGELKEAFKKWARFLHPDKQDPDATVLFRGLTAAYSFLYKSDRPADQSYEEEKDSDSTP